MDRTYFTFRAHRVPDDQIDSFAAKVAEVFDTDPDRWDGVATFEKADIADDGSYTMRRVERAFADALRAGVTDFHDDEVACGTVLNADLHGLTAAAPGAVWECWEDPAYEWLGTWAGYHPDTGLIGPLDCDANGTQTADPQTARAALEAAGGEDGRLTVDEAIAAAFPQARFRSL